MDRPGVEHQVAGGQQAGVDVLHAAGSRLPAWVGARGEQGERQVREDGGRFGPLRHPHADGGDRRGAPIGPRRRVRHVARRRKAQTGRVRQYVMFLVIGSIAVFVLISFFWSPSLAH